MMDEIKNQQLEIDLLLQLLLRRYGYDFTHYAPASFKRRVVNFVSKTGNQHIIDLLPRLMYERDFFNKLLFTISVTVTEMFRDPDFYHDLRQIVVPVLRTYPSLRIWLAGCATGEEVYSMAIMLKEEGLYDRCQIYATDINEEALHQAKQGIYSSELMREYTMNYQQAGGKATLSDYYHCRYDNVIIDQELRKNIVFANHNLVSDGVFGEMHLICCRNVLIYFDRHLQDRALKLFTASLVPQGFLCLGTKESPQFSSIDDQLTEVPKAAHCYQVNNRQTPHVSFI